MNNNENINQGLTNIHLVGCGALGSYLAVEICKRAASQSEDIVLHLYDFDKIEDRNTVSQNFTPEDVGLSKCEVIYQLCKKHKIPTHQHHSKVDLTTMTEMNLDNNSIIIDAVDNVASRVGLWQIGVMKNVPVMHLGMSQAGTGFISWNYKEHDVFQFSPATCDPDVLQSHIDAAPPKSLPPCMLNGFRNLISNTVFAGLASLFIYLGKDPEGFCSDLWENGKTFKGLMTTWTTTQTEIKNIPQMAGLEE